MFVLFGVTFFLFVSISVYLFIKHDEMIIELDNKTLSSALTVAHIKNKVNI